MDSRNVLLEKPNYMLMSLQRILVLFVIFAGVIVVVYYTPMPGMTFCFYETINGYVDANTLCILIFSLNRCVINLFLCG